MREKTSPLGYYTIGIAALFMVGFLLLIIFSSHVYRDTVTAQEGNSQTRALRSYLVTCTQTAASEDIILKEGAEGTRLLIRDAGTAYGQQIFLHDGMLMESYGRLDAEEDPASAEPIARTEVFEVEPLSEDVYAVTTDAGRTILHLEHLAAADGAGGDDQ